MATRRNRRAGGRTPPRLIWQPITMSYTSGARSSDGKTAAVLVSTPVNERYQVIAIETDTKVSTLAAVFNDHAHVVIGDYKTSKLAMKAGERWLMTWLAGKSTRKCECKAIHA